ncbi:MAG TPA: hypothetical protein VGB08_05700 [Allosphingosinicella sp.]
MTGAAARPRRRWLRALGHAAVAAGLSGILGVLMLFAAELATGPALAAPDAARLFVMIAPAAIFGPVYLTLPILALGLVTARSWRGPPPLAIWGLAGGVAGGAASLLLGRDAPVHVAAAALGATAMLVFGYLGREEDRARG